MRAHVFALLGLLALSATASASPIARRPGPIAPRLKLLSGPRGLTRDTPLTLELTFRQERDDARILIVGLDATVRVERGAPSEALAHDSERSNAIELVEGRAPDSTEGRVVFEATVVGRAGASVRCEVWIAGVGVEVAELAFAIDGNGRVAEATGAEIVARQHRDLAAFPRRLRAELEATEQLPFRPELLRRESAVVTPSGKGR